MALKIEYHGPLKRETVNGAFWIDGDRDLPDDLVVSLPRGPRARVRTLGDRDLWEVPRTEALHLLARIARAGTNQPALAAGRERYVRCRVAPRDPC